MQPSKGPPKALIRARVPTVLGRAAGQQIEIVTFDELVDGEEHLALVCYPLMTPTIVRIHSECLTGDVFRSLRCDCGPQLDESLTVISREGGVLLYLRQEGRGIGLYNKLDAYLLQDAGVDTYAANRVLGRGEDERDYTVAVQMLCALGITEIRLLTNSPTKIEQVENLGIAVRSARPTGVYLNPYNQKYLMEKARLANHQLRGLHASDRLPEGQTDDKTQLPGTRRADQNWSAT
jgi:GTP cyclohydrolase II